MVSLSERYSRKSAAVISNEKKREDCFRVATRHPTAPRQGCPIAITIKFICYIVLYCVLDLSP
jgi:hypothetical protein